MIFAYRKPPLAGSSPQNLLDLVIEREAKTGYPIVVRVYHTIVRDSHSN